MDLASLKISIDGSDAKNAADKLDELTEAGAKAEAQTTRLGSSATALSKAQQQMIAMAQQALAASQAATGADVARINVIQQQIDKVRELATVTQNLALVNSTLAEAQSALSNATQSAGAATMNNVETITRLEGATNLGGAGLGRLRQGFVSLVAQATGTIPVLDRTAATFASIGLGTGPVLAAVGVAAAFALALREVGRDTATAKAEQDKLTESLTKWYAAQQQGPGGTLIPEIQAMITHVQALRKELESPLSTQGGLRGALDALLAGALRGGDPTAQASGIVAFFEQFYLKQVKAVTDGGAAVAAAVAEVNRKIEAAFYNSQSELATALSSIITSSGGTAADRQTAEALLQRDRSLLAGAQQRLTEHSPFGDANDVKAYQDAANEVVSLTDDIKKLQDALAALTPAQKAVLDASADLTKLNELQRQGTQALTEQITKEYEALQKSAESAVVKSTVVPKDVFQITGGPLPDLTVLNKDITSINNGLNDLTRQGIAAFSAGLTKSSELTRKADGDAAHLANTIGRDLVKAVVDFAAAGHLSFGTFLKDATNDALRIVGTFDSGVAKLQSDLDTAKKAGADVTRISADLATAQRNAAIAHDAAAGLGGLSLGYSAGLDFGAGRNGALIAAGVGGLSGAIQGAEIAGPLGAAVGGLAGVVGGLLGAAEAHKAAAAALQKAGDALQQSLVGYNASANPVAAALLQNSIQGQQLQNQAQDNLVAAGKLGDRAGVGRAASQFLQAYQEQADNAKKIASDFWDSITQKINAANGPLGAYQNQVDALVKSENQDLASAAALGATQAQVATITSYYDDQLKRLYATYQEGLKQTQLALDARQAAAQGDSAVAAAITRRAAEEKELFDAQQAGYTDAQIAQLKYIQGLEDELAAKQALTRAQESLGTSLAAGPGGTIASQQLAALQPLIDQYTQDLENYNAAVAAGLDPITQLGLQTQLAADAAAIAAQQFQNAVAALQQANSDIENAVAGGHITGAAGLAGERSNLGLLLGIDPSTITDALLNSLYTDPTQGGLTNQQRAANAAIDQYLKDEAQWGPALATAATALATGAGSASLTANTRAITSGAQALTDATGNRMADYLATAVIRLTEIRDDERRAGGGTGVTVTVNVAAGASANDVASGNAIAKRVNESLGNLLINGDRSRGVNVVGGSGTLVGG